LILAYPALAFQRALRAERTVAGLFSVAPGGARPQSVSVPSVVLVLLRASAPPRWNSFPRLCLSARVAR